VCFSPLAAASCLQNPDPEIHNLQDRVNENATDALNQAKLLLEGSANNVSRAAALYAIEAEAYAILELDIEARAAAAKGLALAPGAHDPVHLELLSAYAENVYDKAGLTSAIEALDAARMLEIAGSPTDTCLLISRGLLEHRQDRSDLAIVTLTQAYRASIAPAVTAAHIMSADYLSLVLRSMGDYNQALALNQEKIDWDSSHQATMSLSVSRFMRGQILKLMHSYGEAIDEFEQSRKLSESLGDTQGIAFTDQRICEAHIELGQLEPAARECANAMQSFEVAHSSDALKETQALQARIELGSGHPERALAILNKVLDRNGADLPPRHVGSMYEWRALTNAALHNYREAYSDLQEYLSRYTTANDAERTRQAVAQRARFETDREVERNASLQRELALSQEQSHRQALELRWNAIAVIVGIAVITLLIYFLIANLRYRQQLVTLASTDSLTGLPNRRRTAELATEALQVAASAHQPLTLAIIDMDHFKIINDCCGHATGDHVLKEFARAGREALRATDILGRWGGEEFLLIMPNTPVDLALASLDRLRTLVLGIRLPAGAGADIHVSLSAGLATNDEGAKSLDELVARADAALYTAKNEGRDLVRVAENGQMTSNTGTRRALRLRV
jgi:diguanylate cyclase (GGDEF)-like protein